MTRAVPNTVAERQARLFDFQTQTILDVGCRLKGEGPGVPYSFGEILAQDHEPVYVLAHPLPAIDDRMCDEPPLILVEHAVGRAPHAVKGRGGWDDGVKVESVVLQTDGPYANGRVPVVHHVPKSTRKDPVLLASIIKGAFDDSLHH